MLQEAGDILSNLKSLEARLLRELLVLGVV